MIRDITAATLVAGLMLMNGESLTATQATTQEWFTTGLTAVLATATRHDPALIREDRESIDPKNRDDGCHAYATRVDRHHDNVRTSRLP